VENNRRNNRKKDVTKTLEEYLDTLGIPKENKTIEKYNIGTIIGLIRKGADVNTRNKNGYSSLHFAAHGAKLIDVKRLVIMGANIHAETTLGLAPLGIAIACDQKSIIKYLREELPALIKTLKELLNEFKIPDDNSDEDEEGEEMNYKHPNQADIDTMVGLIMKGTNADTKNDDGRTALHFAVLNNNFDHVQRLVNLRADIEAKDILNHTPFLMAVVNGNVEMAQYLIENGANIHAKLRTKDEEDALTLSVRSKSDEMIDYITDLFNSIDIPEEKDNRQDSTMIFSRTGDYKKNYEIGITGDTDTGTKTQHNEKSTI